MMSQTYTSGIVNYIADYMFVDVTASYKTYKEAVSAITNNIGFKLGASQKNQSLS